MKAMRLRSPGGLDNIFVDYCVSPLPGPREIQVKLHASSLNRHDFLVASGRIPSEDGRIPMSDGSGEVIAIGDEVTEFVVGDHVISTFFPGWLGGPCEGRPHASVPGDHADGYAREMVTASEVAFTKAPAGYSFAEGATLCCAGLTAWRALMVDGALIPGETVVVQGTGGVSIFALQFAKAAGAVVIATSSSDEKLDRLKALGADHVINYKKTPAWSKQVRAITGGRGVDHVVEIGGGNTLAESIRAVRNNGHIAAIGALDGATSSVPTVVIVLNQIRLNGLTVGTTPQQKAMVRAIEANGIRPVIDSRYPLEALADAFRHQLSGRHFGKICIEI